MTTRRLHFSKASLERLPVPPEGRDTYADDQQAGLRLTVFPSGRMSFVLVTKSDGRTRFVTLGQFPEMSVTEARDGAAKARTDLRQGRDPSARRTAGMTLQQVNDSYMKYHAIPYKRTADRDAYLYDRYLAGMGKRPIDRITPAECLKLHQRITEGAGPYQANRVLALLRGIIRHGRDVLGVKMDDPCRVVKLNREVSRRRFLSGPELATFMAALDDPATSVTWRDFFKLALFTGARKSNIASMRWEDVDLAAGVWTIPAEMSKNREPMEIPLLPPAMEILIRRHGAGGKFVFPAPSRSGCVQGASEAWRGLMRRTGIQDLRIHDLRRTLGSWQAAGGASLLVIGKSLGHRSTRATAIYSQLDLDPVRASMTSAVNAMLATVKD